MITGEIRFTAKEWIKCSFMGIVEDDFELYNASPAAADIIGEIPVLIRPSVLPSERRTRNLLSRSGSMTWIW
jgi:hypothetical protein